MTESTFTEREFHPVADIFPMMSDRELTDLTDDIREHGLREPIWLHRDGRIVDGRNRYLACGQLALRDAAAGTERPVLATRTFEGDDSELVSFVVSLNLKRRHLSEAQRSMVGGRIADMHQGARTDLVSIDTKSLDEAAEIMNVGRASVARAKKVLNSGSPELVRAVDSGEVAVSAAALVADAVRDRVAGMPPESVREIVREVAEETRTEVAEARRQQQATAELNAIAEQIDPDKFRDDLGVEVTWPIIRALEKLVGLPSAGEVAAQWPAHLRDRLDSVIGPASDWLADFHKNWMAQ
jgi:ParB-like chromosome segregation protein Spo0J